MTTTQPFAAGHYAYVPGVYQYSAGVVAMPGHEIVHVRFREPPALAAGFARIKVHLEAAGLPLAAFCACELRSPAPFTEAGFEAFNKVYGGTLERWGILVDGINPVARSNVCPAFKPPAEPVFHAFSYVRAAPGAARSCVVAGSGEVPEAKGNYRDHIVAPGDVSAAGMQRKAAHVLSEMKARLEAMDMLGETISCAQVYTVQPLHPLLESTLLPSGLFAMGLQWHYARPPIVGLEFEMDVRVVHAEQVI